MWHVDDLKISHTDKQVVKDFIKWIKDMYKEKDIKKVKQSCGKCHDYLGMDIDYTKPGIFKILMTKYITSMINKFPPLRN